MFIDKSSLDPLSAELLDLLCNALSVLCHNERYGPVEACLCRLNRLSSGDSRRDLPVRLTGLALRADMCCCRGAYADAIGACRQGMQLSGPGSQAYYFFASSALHCPLTEIELECAVDLAAEAMEQAVAVRAPKPFLRILIQTASHHHPHLARSHIRFWRALQDYAVAECGITQEQFLDAAADGLSSTIEAMGY